MIAHRPTPLALALGFGLAVAGAAATAQDGPPSIVVQGAASIEAAPDRVVMQLGVVERADTAEAAMLALAGGLRGVGQVLAQAGIPPENIQTTAFDLTRPRIPQPGTQPRPDERFEARSLLTVTSDDLDGLGLLIDRLAAAGANEMRGMRFTLSDPAPAREAARRDAVADALGAAQTYADAAGLGLGPILRIEDYGGGVRPFAAQSFAQAEGMPIAEGQVSITAQIRMEIAIAR